jgi:RecA-family ATPase
MKDLNENGYMTIKGFNQFSSFKPPIENITPTPEPDNLNNIYRFIIGKEFKNYIDKHIGEVKKKNLYPFVTFSGIFNKREKKGLITHSYLIVIDIDDYPGSINELKKKVSNIRATALAFISPSKKGLKVIFGIDIDEANHKQYFDWLTIMFKEKLGVIIDKSGSDVSRACFLNYDPEAYYNYDFLHLEPSDFEWIDKEKNGNSKTTIESNDFTKIQSCINQLIDKDIDITEHYEDWLKIGFALATLGEEGRDFFHEVSSLYHDYNYDQCNTQFDHCIEKHNGEITIGTFFYYCKQARVFYKNDSVEEQVHIVPNIRTANQRLLDAKNAPDLRKLFSDIWFFPEIHILFADTGIGKSIFATQLGDAISKGTSVFGFSNENEPLRTMFIDFELSDKMFEKRYTNEDTGESYTFSNNFYIDEIDISELIDEKDKGAFSMKNTDGKLLEKIKEMVIKNNISVLFLDNITFLKDLSTQDGQVALLLMKQLKKLQKELGIAMLIIAHTPKIEPGSSISINHLGGSKNLSNFADSISAIGKSSKGEDIRYLKQIKVRNGKSKYHSDNVIEMKLIREGSFLGFQIIECNKEKEHLLSIAKEKTNQLKAEAIKLSKEGVSNRKIADQLNTTHTTINNWLKKEKNSTKK